MLLARPHDYSTRTETINDADGFISNTYRAIAYDPEETAYWCDRPVSEVELTSWHLWLKAQRPDLTERLMADPFYFDPVVAGAWLYGIASWIGDGWCVADGPWVNVDGRLVDRRKIEASGEGVPKKMPEVGTGPNSQMGGRAKGIQAYRGIPKQMPKIGAVPDGPGHKGNTGMSGIQSYRYQGVPKKMPMVNGAGFTTTQGVQTYDTPSALLTYFARLSARLRRVRLLCGDWKRCVKDSVTVNHGLTGVFLGPTDAIFLDPPYPSAEHSMAYHGDNDIWHEAAAWAIERGDDPRLRICIAGYWTEAIDALFPASWERVKWEARGGYSNQSADGRGRANAKRECLWFSKNCLKPADEARAAFDKPITVRDADYTGTMFEEV
jgi:DNA adenine methylase